MNGYYVNNISRSILHMSLIYAEHTRIVNVLLFFANILSDASESRTASNKKMFHNLTT